MATGLDNADLNRNNAQSRNLELMEKFHRQIFSFTGFGQIYESVS